MSLILEVELLTGTYRGTSEPASSAPDWPPQPDRLFSALVAAWAARGELPDERRAPRVAGKPRSPDGPRVLFLGANDSRSVRSPQRRR